MRVRLVVRFKPSAVCFLRQIASRLWAGLCRTPLEDLNALGARAQGLVMLLVIAPAYLASCLLGCRQLIGASVPMVAFANSLEEITASTKRHHLADEITTAPVRLADVFAELQRSLHQHQVAVREPILLRASLRFYPESNMVGVGHKHVVLSPAEFDVLFQLAFAPDVMHTAAWLASFAHRHGASAKQLQAEEIPALRQRFGLMPSRGWRLAASVRSGYRPSVVAAKGNKEVAPNPVIKAAHVVRPLASTQPSCSDQEFAAFIRGTLPSSIEYASPERIFQSELAAQVVESL